MYVQFVNKKVCACGMLLREFKMHIITSMNFYSQGFVSKLYVYKEIVNMLGAMKMWLCVEWLMGKYVNEICCDNHD
jgi:hypothetical protein